MINFIMEKVKANVDNLSDTSFMLQEDEILIDCIPESDAPNNFNLTINELGKKLLQAAQEGEVSKIKQLLAKGAPFTADWLGTSPLHLAALNNHLEVCEIFLRAGMCKDTRTKVERTPLHMAVYEGNLEIVECLLKHGADVDAKDMLHMTPLHWAIQNGHADIVTTLIRNGASTQVRSKFDLTPMDIAVQTDRSDIVQIIKFTPCDPLQAANDLAELNECNVAVEPILQLSISNDETSDSNPQEMPLETVFIDDDSQDFIERHTENEEPEEAEYIEQEPNQMSFNESMKILQQHGITMLPDDESNILSSVMETGHSVVLTEAGKQALNSIQAEKIIPVTTLPKNKAAIVSHQSSFKKKKIITVTADQFLAMTTNGSNSMRIINGKLVQNQPPPRKRIIMKKSKVVPSPDIRSVNVISTNNLQTVRCEPVNDVELLMEQLSKAHALVETYKKRLVKTELELQKYKQKCKLLMDQNNLNNLSV